MKTVEQIIAESIEKETSKIINKIERQKKMNMVQRAIDNFKNK